MQDKIIEFLKERFSMKEVPSKSRKYRLLVGPKKDLYWIGRRGAVRVGRTLSDSQSITDYIRKLMAKEGYTS